MIFFMAMLKIVKEDIKPYISGFVVILNYSVPCISALPQDGQRLFTDLECAFNLNQYN